jgi:hypothetical protein
MQRTLGVVLVVGLLVGTVLAPVAVATHGEGPVRSSQQQTSLGNQAMTQSSDTGEITYFTMDGRGYIHEQQNIVADHPGTPYVWESEPLVTRVTLEPRPSTNTKRVCGYILDENETMEREIGCTSWNSSSRRKRATIELPAWPAGTSGPRYLEYEYTEQIPATNGTNSSNGTQDGQQYREVTHDTYRTEVHVIGKQGDLDGDGLANAREVAEGTDFTRADTDGDGLSDRAEVYQYGSDPLAVDTTGDGIEDGTIASMGLPPTVPYVVHGVVLGGLLAVVAIAVGSLKLWQVLRQPAGPTMSPAPQGTSSGTSAGEAAANGAPRSKEDEVFQVIKEHGGQMRQADLVDETEWSKATVSRLLSTLEDDGRVEKIRVGRGNVVRLTEGADEDANLAGTTRDGG